MEWIDSLMDWGKANETMLWWLFAGSIAAFLLTTVTVSWTLVRLPADYFTKEERRPLDSWSKRPVLRIALLVVKNVLGVLLILAGIAMMMLPGQGVLTLVVGLVLTDYPGKFRLQRWIVKKRSVWRSINWLRKRAHREPLKRPEE
jgi:hypothetical protein